MKKINSFVMIVLGMVMTVVLCACNESMEQYEAAPAREVPQIFWETDTVYQDVEVPVRDTTIVRDDNTIKVTSDGKTTTITLSKDGVVSGMWNIKLDSLLIHTTKENLGDATITENNGTTGKTSDLNGWTANGNTNIFKNMKMDELSFNSLDSLTAIGTFRGSVEANVVNKDGASSTEVIPFELPYLHLAPYVMKVPVEVTKDRNIETRKRSGFGKASITVLENGVQTRKIEWVLDSTLIHRSKSNIGKGIVNNGIHRGTISDGNAYTANIEGIVLNDNCEGVAFQELDSLHQLATAGFSAVFPVTEADGNVVEKSYSVEAYYLHVRPAELPTPKEPEVVTPEVKSFSITAEVEKITSGSQLYASLNFTIVGSDGTNFNFKTTAAQIGHYGNCEPMELPFNSTVVVNERSESEPQPVGEPKSMKKGLYHSQMYEQKVLDKRYWKNHAGGNSGTTQDVAFLTYVITYHHTDGQDYVIKVMGKTEFLEDSEFVDPNAAPTLEANGNTSVYSKTVKMSANHFLSASMESDGMSFPVEMTGLDIVDGKYLFLHNEGIIPIYCR